jgi:Tfp pilus assembly protein PilF
VAAATLAVHWGSLGHDFVGLDDVPYVTGNAAVLGRHYASLLGAVVAGNFHPLTLFTLAWNVSTPLSARPFLATNLALHVANTLLVFWLVADLSGRRLPVAAFVSLLFGIHPMHVESVAWISERKDVLYAVFFLGGLVAYWHHLVRRRPGLLALTFALFVLSCLSKGMAVVFPLVMGLLDFWAGRPVLERRSALEKLPFLVVSLAVGLVAYDVQGGGTVHGLLHPLGDRAAALTSPMALGPWQRFSLPTHSIMTYVARVFAPLHLSAFEPYPSPQEMAGLSYRFAPLVLVAMVGLVLWDRKRTRVLAFGLGWFLVTIAIVLQWVPVGGAIVADRYSYVSYIGLFFILGMGLQAAFERRRRLGSALWVAAALFVLFLVPVTLAQASTWRNSETLWQGILKEHPRQAWVYSVRGVQRMTAGQARPALEDFRMAWALGLQGADMCQALGSAYGATGQLDSSLRMLDRGLAMDSTRGGLYYNRAATRLAMGRPREALDDMARAIRLLPERAARLHAARGHLLAQLGDDAAALTEFNAAAATDSAGPELLDERGLCRLRLGDRAGAEQDFRAALQRSPGDSLARAALRKLGT